MNFTNDQDFQITFFMDVCVIYVPAFFQRIIFILLLLF